MLEWVNCYTSPCGLSDGARWERSHEQWLVIVCVCVHRQEKDPKIRVRGLFHFVLQETKKKTKQKKGRNPKSNNHPSRSFANWERHAAQQQTQKCNRERETDRRSKPTGFGAVWEGKSWPILYCHYLNWLDFNTTKNKANTRIIVTGANVSFQKILIKHFFFLKRMLLDKGCLPHDTFLKIKEMLTPKTR